MNRILQIAVRVMSFGVGADGSRVAHLERDIQNAFANVPYPGDSSLFPHQCGECDRLRQVYTGSHWSDPKIERLGADVGPRELMGDDGWRYYFPALLLFLLRHPARVRELGLKADDFDPCLFTTAQLRAIRDTLEYVGERSDA
ncbi:MAG: hypothetical protein HY078_01945 [Elusimicrobia bacterium]|nr:hypothetical protein [Elusimicrobiota bacterium]